MINSFFMGIKNEITESAAELCKRFGIKRLALFGSIARGDESFQSDIDFLAEFDSPSPESMPDRYFGFINAASERFHRPVQVLTPRMVKNPFLKQSIEKDLVIVYE